MKLVVLKKNLKDGLGSVDRATSENANLPILKNVLIKTYNNKIQLSATNLELAITKLVSGKIIEEGSITVPLSIILSITNNVSDERINLEVENNTLTLKTDNYKAVIQGLPEEEFPIIPKLENTKNFLKIESGLLKESLLKVINAAQLSDIRPEISGVLLDFQVTNFKLVATDSFRLAEKTVNENGFESTFPRGFKIIIPLKTAQELLRIISDGPVMLFIDPNQLLFKNEGLEVISRLIDGVYPDYEQIVPDSFETEITLERNHLINAVKLVSSFSGKVNDIKMCLKDGSKSLEVHSANQYLGENRYLIPIKLRKGANFEVSFNWKYFLDGLKNFGSQEVTLGVNSDNKPTVIKNPDNASYFYIIMPIKNT